MRTAGSSGQLALGVIAAGVCLLSACAEPPQPRNFADFMEDRIAREGTLARCNADREATLNDIECANARRAAASIALRRERERREALERESELKLAALRDEIAARERQAQLRAEQEAVEQQRAYERLWNEARGGLQSSEPTSASGGADASQGLLEEVRVPTRFGWRPAGE